MIEYIGKYGKNINSAAINRDIDIDIKFASAKSFI